jgi:predicted Zn-dependent peptidase
MERASLIITLSLLSAGLLQASEGAKVPVETFELSNGMRFLAVVRPELSTVSAGWVARVGSANERPGITGMSHFFEHMMFKGSRTLGTRNLERDLQIISEQEKLQEEIRAIYRKQRERYRLGEIDDPFADEARPEELVELQRRFDALTEEQRSLMVKDEYDRIYTAAGASGVNAFTSEDVTVYFLTVPANKLELWFWMESDRLLSPVFREFYSERDVVHEERRLRTESTPTGEFVETFDALFWQSHPYNWPVVGWPSDLRSYSLAQAEEYFDTYYAPNNLTAALVGNFDLDEVRALAERYFGRLPRREPAPDVVTLEMDPRAEKRMVAECDCQPQVEIRYHTVPFRHRDSYALEVLAGLLNGRSGRLYKSLVLERGLAADASAAQDSRKYAGAFSLYAEAKGEATPEDLERALLEEVGKLAEEPIPDREIQKVKNQITASAYERLSGGFHLLVQLLLYDGLGDWEYLNEWAETMLAVTASDVKRAAETYLDPEERTVGLYYRESQGAEP